MIHHIQQKPLIRNYIKITLDNDFGGGTYVLVLEKDQQGHTTDRWVESEEGSCLGNNDLLKSLIEQYNRDTEPNK
jgi:hypothetical protein